ncbi:MFS transporter [Longispora urticae]
MRVTKFLEPLQNTAFRHQFLAQSTSLLGTMLAPVALAFGVLEATDSAGDLGLVLTAYTVPMLVFMLVGGVWADRLPRQRLMMIADSTRFVTQSTFGVLVLTGHAQLWSMIALQAVAGTAAAFNMPAAMGLTRDTARPEHLQQANALLSLSRDLASTVGPLIAGGIIASAGAGWALLFDGLTFAGSVYFLSRLTLPARPPGEPSAGFVAELRDGWREVSKRSWVWVSIIYFMVFNLVFAVFQVIGPVSMADKARGALSWGAVAAALAAGELLGNALALRVRPRRPLRVSRYVELLAVPVIVALGLGAPVPVLIGAALLMGIAVSFPDSLWMTALQQHVPEESISRVMSFDLMGSFVLRPVSYTAAAAAAAAFGAGHTLVAGALLLAVATLATLLLPGVRNLTRIDTPEQKPDPVAAA